MQFGRSQETYPERPERNRNCEGSETFRDPGVDPPEPHDVQCWEQSADAHVQGEEKRDRQDVQCGDRTNVLTNWLISKFNKFDLMFNLHHVYLYYLLICNWLF